MESAMRVADYICNEYRKLSGEAIDEMKLHKLLYFAQRESIAVIGEPLFNDVFEGWRYGPVCVAVRGSFYQGEMIGIDGDVLSPTSAYIVKNVILQYGKYASWKLSQMTHAEISWLNSRKGFAADENGSVPLALSDIVKDAEKIRPYDPVWDMYLDEFDDEEVTA